MMNATEARKKAQQARFNSFEDVLALIKRLAENAATNGKPSLNVDFADSLRKLDCLDRVVKHFKDEKFDVSVDENWLTIYWGYEGSEVEAQ